MGRADLIKRHAIRRVIAAQRAAVTHHPHPIRQRAGERAGGGTASAGIHHVVHRRGHGGSTGKRYWNAHACQAFRSGGADAVKGNLLGAGLVVVEIDRGSGRLGIGTVCETQRDRFRAFESRVVHDGQRHVGPL